ncbi:MAG: trigger factor [Nioella sp.]|nr:trigger factor [Nioella sp.]
MKLADFRGRWRLTRRIDDARAGVVGRLDGQALFTVEAQGLVLTETGLLRYGDGPPMRAERRYLWRAEGRGIAVFFDDGRPFHWFSGAATKATHDCPPDLYRVRYDFSDWPDWRTIWHVTGPRKAYEMVSHYTPDGRDSMQV